MSADSISFSGAFFLLFGIAMLILQKPIASQTVYWNLRLWKYTGTERGYQFAFALGGIAFFIIGILDLLGVVKYRD